ncbi:MULTISPECIES: hypothetical protein [Halostella]|uniref:hypothetical protein n=1 Tax=Halostella TaxID=1843185 RepID=UPI001F035BC4|nr:MULTISPECIES: hypothetical protein [Halostella]
MSKVALASLRTVQKIQRYDRHATLPTTLSAVCGVVDAHHRAFGCSDWYCLFVPSFYRDAEVHLPQLYGQDLLTFIVAVPTLTVALYYAHRGSLRGYVAFQLLVAGLMALLWLGEVGPASLAGTRPPSIAETTLPVPVIQSLDLGVVVPSFALSAAYLWKHRAWGYVFTDVLLVKGTTLGLAVLAMIVFMLQNGQSVPLPQIVLFALLSLTGLTLVTRFIRAIPPDTSATHPHA